MILLIIVASSLLAVAVGLSAYARWNYGVLESLGFTVVKPLHFVLGNTADFHSKVTHLEDIKRFRKYGPIYGVYEGRYPQVHVCDAALMKCMMVTDYEYFKNRRQVDFGSQLLNEIPDFLPYSKWKAVRQLLTPSFTAAKIKIMSLPMKECLDDFTEQMKKEISIASHGKHEKYDLTRGIFTMLTDMIARCVFGIKIDNKENSNNHFVKIVKAIVEGGDGNAVNFVKSLSFTFPILNRFAAQCIDIKAADAFVETFKIILKTRKASGINRKYFVDQILDWMDKLDTDEFKNKDITDLTLFCQALTFFFAGQDQISSIVSYAIHSAAKDKSIEDKILNEMDDFLEKYDGKIIYDNLNELTYLRACLTEALRMVPFFTRAERICTKDWEMNGITIKKGITVIFPLWAANRNPEYFPHPDQFDPERFLSPNKEKLHPYAMTSFGFGPKNCLGARFSNDVMLMTAAYLYRDFEFKNRLDSQNMNYLPGFQCFAVKSPSYIDVTLK